MTQDELWQKKHQEIISFIEENHRRTSKSTSEGKSKGNRWEHRQKLMNAGDFQADRIKMFNELLALGEQYKHINQWV